MSEKRYYWLRLKRDFFKRHDIRIIESMPNGKDYILFYLKLLCESVDHDGNLRFSDEIPYNEDMLSTITNTNVDIVRNAINIFTDLHMMDILDDGTYFMSEVQRMIGSESYWAETKRIQRAKLDNVQTLSIESPTCPSKRKSKSNSKSKSNIFTPPTLDDIEEYCRTRNSNVNAKQFFDYYQEGNWKDSSGKPVKNWKQKLITWEKHGNSIKISIPDYIIQQENGTLPDSEKATQEAIEEARRLQQQFK